MRHNVAMDGSLLSILFWALSVSALALSALMAVILGYHWFRYGLNAAAATGAMILYLTVCGGLLLILFAGAIAVTL